MFKTYCEGRLKVQMFVGPADLDSTNLLQKQSEQLQKRIVFVWIQNKSLLKHQLIK